MIAKPAEYYFFSIIHKAECRENLHTHPKKSFKNMGAYKSHYLLGTCKSWFVF